MGVRRLAEDDWTLLQDVRLAALRTDPLVFGSSLAREEGFREMHWRMRLRGSPWFAAFDDDEPLGPPAGLICVIAEPGAPPEHRHVVSMWVRPGCRRRGHGSALLAAAVDAARADGADALTLWLVDGNEEAAALYSARGFRPTGERTALVRDPSLSEERWLLAL